MGMYSYISLRIWVHEEKRPANQQETQQLIQALYDDKEANPNQEAQYAFDLEGDCKNEVKWYKFDQDMLSFSQKHPEYSFILQVYGTGEFEDEFEIRAYFQGKSYKYDQYFYSLDFVDFDSCTEDLFKPNFTLFNSIEELKSKVILSEDNNCTQIFIPTTQQQQSVRVKRILYYQAMQLCDQLDLEINSISQYPNEWKIKPAVEVRSYQQDNAKNFIDTFFQVAEQYLIGELR